MAWGGARSGGAGGPRPWKGPQLHRGRDLGAGGWAEVYSFLWAPLVKDIYIDGYRKDAKP